MRQSSGNRDEERTGEGPGAPGFRFAQQGEREKGRAGAVEEVNPGAP